MLGAITKLFHNTLIKTLIWIAAISVVANLLVLLVSRGHCYASAEEIPNACFGLILGTGRSAAPSPYYDGRVQASIDLWKAKKVVAIIISGENQYEDYHEVDSMAAALKEAIPDAPLIIDQSGTNTYRSLYTAGNMEGYHSSYIIISQHPHNQRALFMATVLYGRTPNAIDAADTANWSQHVRLWIREYCARTWAVVGLPMYIFSCSKDIYRTDN